jgi:methylthioribose-1-phosphate isomerase
MHIQQLQKFLSYTPVFDENPQHLVDEIISETKKYIPDLDKEKIQFAYEFAKAAHSD